MSETWKPIVGWSRFEVSDRGRVRRLGRWSRPPRHYWIAMKVLKVQHRSVELKQKGQTKKSFTVAELVLTAFVGPRSHSKSVARHLDDVVSNNRLGNLAWGSYRDNRLDAIKNGITLASAPSKLTTRQVVTIRRSKKLGCVLAAKYGVARSTISGIRRLKSRVSG